MVCSCLVLKHVVNTACYVMILTIRTSYYCQTILYQRYNIIQSHSSFTIAVIITWKECPQSLSLCFRFLLVDGGGIPINSIRDGAQ